MRVRPAGLFLSTLSALAFATAAEAAPSLCLQGLDQAPPQASQRQARISHDSAPEGLVQRGGWTTDWQEVAALCGVRWADECTPREQLITAITEVRSSDPEEGISGAPGAFTSDRIIVDDRGFIVSLDPQHPARTYTFTLSAVDAAGQRGETQCAVAVERFALHSATPTEAGLSLVLSKSFEGCVTVEHQRSGPRGPVICAQGEGIEVTVPVPGEGPVQLCHAADRRACTPLRPRGPALAMIQPQPR